MARRRQRGFLDWIDRTRKKGSVEILVTRIEPLRLSIQQLIVIEKQETRKVQYYLMCIVFLNEALRYLDQSDVDSGGAYYHLAKRYKIMADLESDSESGASNEGPGTGGGLDPFGSATRLEEEKDMAKPSIAVISPTNPASSRRQDYITRVAETILIEGRATLGKTGIDKLEKWLLSSDGSIRQNLPVENLVEAQKLIDLHEEDEFFKVNLAQLQLIYLSIVTIGLIIVIVFLLGLGHPNTSFDTIESVLTVAFFGALGGALSGIYTLSKMTLNSDVERPMQLLDSLNTLVKPLYGAAAAIVIATLILSGIVNFGTISISLLLAVAFVSGFSEKIISGAVEITTKKNG